MLEEPHNIVLLWLVYFPNNVFKDHPCHSMSDCAFFLRLNNMPLCVYNGAFQVVLVVKNPPANAGDLRHEFDPWVGKIPWRRKWQPTPVFLPGRSHGQRSLAGYSPQGRKESDMAWRLSTHAEAKRVQKRLEFSCWAYFPRDRELGLLWLLLPPGLAFSSLVRCQW